jgi:antitoxin ParD1/3/4
MAIKLLRQHKKSRDAEKLEALLLEGLGSGDPVHITPEYWENKHMQLLARHARLRKKRRRLDRNC